LLERASLLLLLLLLLPKPTARLAIFTRLAISISQTYHRAPNSQTA